MGVFFGGNKVKVMAQGVACVIRFREVLPDYIGVLLKSLDEYYLDDINGVRLTAEWVNADLKTAAGQIFKTKDGSNLMTREVE